MNKNSSYVVKDSEGEYISSYNTCLGEKAALSYAQECAKRSKANVFLKEGDNEKLILRYRPV